MTRFIRSIHHPLISHWVKLRDRSEERKAYNSVFLEGIKPVFEVCSHLKAHTLILEEETPWDQGSAYAEEVIYVSARIMRKISSMESTEGVAAIFPLPAEELLEGKKNLIALDKVSDPGNVGALLRTALALGWQGAFLIDGCCDPFNDKALRAARGATFRLPLRTGSWQQLRLLMEKERYSALAADIDGLPLPSYTAAERRVLVMGNEAIGLSCEARQLCQRITIPLNGNMESLNVAAAGAILMYTLGV